jgi:DNA-binding transcriptional LysR family regulator
MAYPGDLLEHLRSLSVLADRIDRGGAAVFANAARDLAVDVSVLRRRLQTLARHVGAPLFAGRGERLRLTPAGVNARAKAVRALGAVAELSASTEDDVGPLRVACTGAILGEVLPRAFRVVREKHPRLGFRARRAGSVAARELLDRGEVDFAIVRARERPSGVRAQRLGNDRLFVAVADASPLAQMRRPSLGVMAREPLVGYGPASATMRRVLEILAPLGAAPWIEVDGKAAALAYVAEELGIAFVSALAGQLPQRDGVTLIDVTSSFPPLAFWLVSGSREPTPGWRATFASVMGAAVSAAPDRSRSRSRSRTTRP